MDRYFVWNPNAREPLGPFAPELLHRMVEEGAIHARTLLVRDGGAEWSPASELPVLASRLPRSVEPVAPPRVGKPIASPPPVRAIRPAPRVIDDASFDLEILELNDGNRRSWLEYGVLTAALNAGLVVAGLNVAINPLSGVVLLATFVVGNLSLSWLFGVVMR